MQLVSLHFETLDLLKVDQSYVKVNMIDSGN